MSNERLASLEAKFNQLVGIVQRDMTALQVRIAKLEAEHKQTGRSLGDTEIQRGTAGDEVVAFHPATGKPITAKEVDPKLAMRLRFSEEEA